MVQPVLNDRCTISIFENYKINLLSTLLITYQDSSNVNKYIYFRYIMLMELAG